MNFNIGFKQRKFTIIVYIKVLNGQFFSNNTISGIVLANDWNKYMSDSG
jgi:hypothetical protein